MANKIIKKISQVNQIFIFLGFCVLSLIFGIRLISDLLEPPYEAPKVEIVQGNAEISQTPENGYKLTHVAMIQDIHVLRMTSDKVIMQNKINDSDSFNMFSGVGGETTTVNLLLVDSNNSSYKLFDQDTFIQDFKLVNTADDQRYIDHYDEIFLNSKNIYSVINTDTNQDGFLSDEDQRNLYISDYNGLNLQLVLKNINRYQMIKDDLVLVKQRIKGKDILHTYDLSSFELKQLNTAL